jgi:hemerythrin-like domain-containing protein
MPMPIDDVHPGQRLRREHERLALMLDDLIDRFAEGNQRDVGAAWGEFEQALMVHLDFEDRYILPGFASVDPVETQALRDEHLRLRKLFAELGVGVDLHLVRLELVRQFAGRLREHSHREDLLLYRWVDRELAQIMRGIPGIEVDGWSLV